MSENKSKYTNNDLKIMQSWDLQHKIQVSKARIIEFSEKFDNKIYDLLYLKPFIL